MYHLAQYFNPILEQILKQPYTEAILKDYKRDTIEQVRIELGKYYKNIDYVNLPNL